MLQKGLCLNIGYLFPKELNRGLSDDESSTGACHLYHNGDRRVNELPPKDRDIAMVFQFYALYPHMSVFENMEFSLELQGKSRSEIKQRVHSAAQQSQIDKVDEQLEQLTSVYSPYRGKVRRVKILGQNERSITAEVTLDIRDGK